MEMTHLGLFEGIGGFSLAARWAGWETIAWCEWNEFGQRVLRHHFPNAIGHGDITKTDFTIYANKIDVLTGGFPCQPYSTAGKRLGKDDERHLWPEMLRAIREIAPRWVVGENVRGLVNWNGGMVFDEVQADLEASGYEVLAFILPACAKDAPHRRDRVWFVGHAKHDGLYATEVGGDEQESSVKAKQVEVGEFTGASGVESSRVVADTINNGLEHSIHGGSEGQVFEKSGGEGVNLTTEFTQSIEADGLRGYVANSEGEGSIRLPERKETAYAINGINGFNGIASDTNGTSSQTWSQRQILGQSNRQKTNGHRNVERTNQWQNFPTQSPICSGDDGLPTELDGITFSKWRNESIKAYGNAIVPQVAYEIFKAINAYEEMISSNK